MLEEKNKTQDKQYFLFFVSFCLVIILCVCVCGVFIFSFLHLVTGEHGQSQDSALVRLISDTHNQWTPLVMEAVKQKPPNCPKPSFITVKITKILGWDMSMEVRPLI